MEEELTYSTIVFGYGSPPPKETNEENTIYVEVKPKEHAAEKSTTVPTDGEAAAHTQHFRLLAACLGIICVLLVAAIITIIYFNMEMSEQKANLNNLTTQNLQLRTERTSLVRQTEELSREKDGLNWTLGVIFEFKKFPVDKYCSQKVKAECKPCRDGWILFQQSCYLFSYDSPFWSTWERSRQHCQTMTADLVVVGSPQEEEFINNHTEYYFDKCHGYWIGLSETADNNWLWVDGSNQTLGYWIMEPLGDTGRCTLTIPQRAPMASWDKADCAMHNRWICEGKALFKSN